MSQALDDTALDTLFRNARTHNSWHDRAVPDELLIELYETLKWGPTSMNCTPARFVFVKSREAKERLRKALSPGNVDKTMAAPVTVIVAHDSRFYEHLPTLFPHSDGKALFEGNAELAATTMFRNGTLQGAYLILAARALGLDVGPMSGFNNARLDAEFFPDGRFRSNFLANLGFGDGRNQFPRGPRLDFDQAASII